MGTKLINIYMKYTTNKGHNNNKSQQHISKKSSKLMGK